MLWNPNDAIDRANRSGDDTDPESKMKISELMSIKVRVDTLRDLSLAVFTKIPMEATLGANFWSDRHDESLKDFAAQPWVAEPAELSRRARIGRRRRSSTGVLVHGRYCERGAYLSTAGGACAWFLGREAQHRQQVVDVCLPIGPPG